VFGNSAVRPAFPTFCENDEVSFGFPFPESTRVQGFVEGAAFGLGQTARGIDELGDVGHDVFLGEK
jgi:hypothetical protein